jgi:hypothetical protein
MSFLSKLFGLGLEPQGPPQSAAIVRGALLAINRPTAPFQVRVGAADEADLVAESRIVDAVWYEIFAKAGLKKAFKVLMRLDENSHEVRAVDQEWSVEWRAGVPKLSWSASAGRGQMVEIEYGKAYGFTEAHGFGEIYNYRFTTAEIKTPLQKVVAAKGWTWKPVRFGKL